MPALVILDQDVSINLGEVTLDAFDDPVDVAQVALDGETIVLGQLLRETLELRSSPMLCSRASTASGLVRANGGFHHSRRSPGAFCPEGAAKAMDTSSAVRQGSNRPAVPSATAGLSIADAPRGRTAFAASAHAP